MSLLMDDRFDVYICVFLILLIDWQSFYKDIDLCFRFQMMTLLW